MPKLKTQVAVTMALGALSLVAGLLSHLALTDIYHGEAEVTLEWSIVRACAAVLFVFIAMAMLTLGRVMSVLSRTSA